jgi:hypothetical protein
MSIPVSSGIKIVIALDPAEQQGVDTESLWAERVSAETFRIRNSPFFAFDLSAEDIVRAEKVGGEWQFREVVERGGHSTYRVYLLNERELNDDDVQQAWQPIAAIGATYENANSRFFSVDIPPGSDIEAIYALLERGEAESIWEFEEAHYEPFPDASSSTPDA